MSYPLPTFQLRQATSSSDLDSIRTLFTSYVSWLDLDLTFQDYASELAPLPGLYTDPTGCLLLARLTSSGEAVGCVALRPLKKAPSSSDAISPSQVQEREGWKVCEMKRLYATEAARGLGIGKALIEAVIEKAKKLGYQEIKLDTLPRMASAIELYKRYGFEECERYYETPLEGTVFLRKKLV